MNCDVAHAIHYSATHPAAYDLRRYVRIVGLPKPVRFLCEDCSVGRIAPRFKDEYRIKARGAIA